MGRYYGYLPDENTPTRFQETLGRFKKFYYGSATERERSKIHKLRVNPKRQNDIKGYRRILGIPEQGYGRLEAKKQLGPLAQACLELEHNIKGAYKRKAEAGAWLFIVRCAQKLADVYRLRKNYPTPLALAFEDLIYNRPRPQPTLRGYFIIGNENQLDVVLEDAITKAPHAIARVIKYRWRGDDNEVTRQIRIFNRHSSSGEWQITNLDSICTQ